jgi:hypothetical protein
MNRSASFLVHPAPCVARASRPGLRWWQRAWRALCAHAERPDRVVPYC